MSGQSSYITVILSKAQDDQDITLQDLEELLADTKLNPFVHWDDYYEDLIRCKFLYEYSQNINKLSRPSVEAAHLSYLYLMKTLQIVESKDSFDNAFEWMAAINQRTPNLLDIYRQRILLLVNHRTAFAYTLGGLISGFTKSSLLGISYVEPALKQIDTFIFADSQTFEGYYERGKDAHDLTEYSEFFNRFIKEKLTEPFTKFDVNGVIRVPNMLFQHCLNKVKNSDFDFQGILGPIIEHP